MSDDGIRRTYPRGTASWIDLETPDALEVAPFYERVLGWTLTDAMPPGAPGHYLIGTIRGEDAGAIASGVASIGTEPVWSTYFAVDDADAAALAVERAGGRIVAPPADTPGGRPVACVDPEGAPFRLWQAGRRLGAQVVNEPGAWNFSDLRTADAAAALAFYAAFLPWAADAPEGGATMIRVPGYGDYLAATVDPGIRERQRFAPEGFEDVIGRTAPLEPGGTPRWEVLFTVEDRDTSADAVLAAGGEVETTGETDWTRFAQVRDPAGARFTLSQFTPQEW